MLQLKTSEFDHVISLDPPEFCATLKQALTTASTAVGQLQQVTEDTHVIEAASIKVCTTLKHVDEFKLI